jgi:hypothetical protein
MGEMKSAFDRAMERADKMGKLSPEEMRQRQEADYLPVGWAIAERYLNHGHEQLFKEEVDKHDGERRGIVVRAALGGLGAAVSLTGYERTEKALNGVLALIGDNVRLNVVNSVIGDITGLLAEFGQELERKYGEEQEQIEKSERELLHQLRISGSAIGAINMAASQAWGKVYREFSSTFEERLERLKGELLKLLEQG